MTQSLRSHTFGRRREPHTVIIARGDEIRHFTIRPWVAALTGSALAAVAIGYLLATSYLVLRDDLLGASAARQARMQQAYEDRISALRAQVDRITSRQLLDQQLMESKVSELLARQTELTERHGRIGPMLERGQADTLPEAAPVPAEKPDERADARTTLDGLKSALASATAVDSAGDQPFSFWSTRAAIASESAADHADKLFVAINQSLRTIEDEQMVSVNSLAENAYQTADAIREAAEEAGLELDVDGGKEGLGGPLIPLDHQAEFDTRVKELDAALDTLDAVKAEVRRLPIANPAPGLAISSTFGVRRDPILGTPALHSGMDFRAPMGTDVYATAPGTVVKAGPNGGYGRMVEIDHGHGFTTRYAHLSRIAVKPGDRVVAGRRARPLRQHRPLDRSAPPLRGPPRQRRGRSAALPEGGQGDRPVL